jgi:septum formation protein
MSDLILASTSETRRAMLSSVGVSFKAMAPMIDEESLKDGLRAEGLEPRSLADALAEAKAVKLSGKYPSALVVGADQILAIEDDVMLDKAETPEAAKAQLTRLSGHSHRLFSAAVVAAAGVAVWRHIGIARMLMRPLTDKFIDSYVEQNWEQIRNSVGCYQIEGPGAQLFTRVEGDHFDILGLPLLPLLGFLRERGNMPS